jgi:hypothetical protein
MKSRTMVYLEPEQLQSLQLEARNQRISLAELMRRLVRNHLTGDKGIPAAPKEAYLKIVGLGSSGKQDISEKHDHYLGKAIRREPTR